MTAFARLYRSIWIDPEFRLLDPISKLLYVHLVSHPKLSRCGALDVQEDRWARALGVPSVTVNLAELEADRFVVVDRDTEEIVIRSYVKNDGFAGNWKMVKAMWRAWESVESEALREVIVANCPQEVWKSAQAPPPRSALIAKDLVERRSIANAIGDRSPIPSPMASPFPTATTTATVTATATHADQPNTDDGIEPDDDHETPSALPHPASPGLATGTFDPQPVIDHLRAVHFDDGPF